MSVSGSPTAWTDPHGASVDWIAAAPGQLTRYEVQADKVPNGVWYLTGGTHHSALVVP